MRWGILDDDGGYFHCIIYSKLGTFPTRGRHAPQPTKNQQNAPNQKSLPRARGKVAAAG